MAEAARRFRGSVPVFMPQRGWKPADTTVNLSAAIGRKSPEARKRLLGKVGRRRHVSYVKKLIERKLPAGGIKRKELWKNSPPTGTQSDFSQADTAEYPLYIPPSGIDKSVRFQ